MIFFNQSLAIQIVFLNPIKIILNPFSPGLQAPDAPGGRGLRDGKSQAICTGEESVHHAYFCCFDGKQTNCGGHSTGQETFYCAYLSCVHSASYV